VLAAIAEGFRATPYPGDAYIQGSSEGCEPFEEVQPFGGKDWRELDAAFLDAHYAALSFFSEGGFRYFLPAYLTADVRGLLATADPTFSLTHGFSDATVSLPAGGRTLVRRMGRSVLLNPRRYGAMTIHDYARYRLSVFTREEAVAIVAYLEHRRAADPVDAAAIEAALETFWRERARSAPTADDLRRHLAEEEEMLAAIRNRSTGEPT